jgi:phage gpG-like protein
MARFIQIDFSQLSNILSELQAVGDRASDLRPVARAVAIVIQSYTDRVFNSAPPTTVGGTVFNGEFWDQLSLKYRAARNREKKKSRSRDNGKILRDTGALLNSLQVNGAGNFFQSGNDFVEFGTDLPQGFNNNTRTFLTITDDLEDQVVAVLENYILSGQT